VTEAAGPEVEKQQRGGLLGILDGVEDSDDSLPESEDSGVRLAGSKEPAWRQKPMGQQRKMGAPSFQSARSQAAASPSTSTVKSASPATSPVTGSRAQDPLQLLGDLVTKGHGEREQALRIIFDAMDQNELDAAKAELEWKSATVPDGSKVPRRLPQPALKGAVPAGDQDSIQLQFKLQEKLQELQAMQEERDLFARRLQASKLHINALKVERDAPHG
ncbi:unnamed protein product, partial [Polarella glacialis]